MEFLARYAMQLLSSAVLVLAIIGGYYYWKNTISEEGYSACMVEVEKRDEYTNRQSEKIRQEAKEQYDIEKEKIENAYTDAINVWAGYADGLRSSTKTTPRASSNSCRVQRTKASCPESDTRSSEETLSIKAVELIIEKICLPHMDIR